MLKKNQIQWGSMTALYMIFVLTFHGCAPENPHQVDLSGYQVEIPVIRSEADIFKMKSMDDFELLQEKDSNFFDVYIFGIMSNVTGGPRVSREENARALLDFVGNADMQHLYRTVDSTFKDFGPYQDRLNEAFSYYNYHFGKDKLPKIYTFVSPFNYNAVGFDQNLAIGLDLYLGPDFGPYLTPQLNFPQFKIAKMRSNSLVADAMKAWLMNQFPKEDQDRSLLGEMIYEGKILYAMDAMLPEMHDSLKIGYVKGQIEWCEGNNFQIWQHLVENDLLYSTDLRQYSGVITDGPFSKGQNVPQESSPRMAVWTGWQIVRAYMEKNKELKLADLMKDTDYESILKKSAYKP